MSKRIIQALSDYEHVRIRPTMYVGQIEKTDIKAPQIETKDNETYIKRRDFEISPAFYKLYDEVLANAFDEAIRMGGKMKSISIYFDTKTREVTVIDTGNGFYMGTELNEKTNRSNIETAFTHLKAGTNFDDTREEMVIGTNGVGVSLVNMLSEYFEVETTNQDFVYTQRWTKEDWQANKLVEPTIKERPKTKQTGTKITFKPDSQLFRGNNWDYDYVYTSLVLKNFAIKEDETLAKVKFKAYFDKKELNLDVNILPSNAIKFESPIGKIWFYPALKDGLDLSYINGQLCTGIHQKIVNDFINDKVFEFQYAHWWYNTIVLFNLKPNLVRFADQNKTRFATGRWEIEPLIDRNFFKKLRTIKSNASVFKAVMKKIDEYRRINEVKDLKKARKKAAENKSAFTSKYYPPSRNKEMLFISEGLSASGGLIESRDTRNIGVYALKGKIKNTQRISDLTDSQEIIQLLNVLDLELDKKTCSYQKVVVAVDADNDGKHISSLLINLFHKWFPFLIEEGRLFLLQTPVISARIDNKLTHFYKRELFYNGNFKNVKDKSYIKGLGALSEDDWKLIFKNVQLIKIKQDKQSEKYLEIAFGKEAGLRKKWLQNKL